jgi:hypothetical protein
MSPADSEVDTEAPTATAIFSQDNEVDLEITRPRLDADDAGRLPDERSEGMKPGPRQRRFEFDAKVIRDSVVRKLRLAGREDLALPIDHCHRDAVYKRCVGCRHVKTFYNRCERFYCPVCAARLARDRRETIEWWSKVVNQPKHVVLTVKSVPVLTKDYVRKLKGDLRRMRGQEWAKEGKFLWRATAITPHAPQAEPIPGHKRQRGRLSPWSGRKLGSKTTKWRGGFWSIDATLNEGGWHIHFHAIVDADFIDRDELERSWAKLRGQEMAVVRVFDVRGKNYVAEACKYVCDGVQLGNWPADKLVEFCDSLSNERCFDTFGALYKQRAEWTKAKEEIHADRDVCACGCRQFVYFDENEWEWQQAKAGLAPPVNAPRQAYRHEPELFAPVVGLVK